MENGFYVKNQILQWLIEHLLKEDVLERGQRTERWTEWRTTPPQHDLISERIHSQMYRPNRRTVLHLEIQIGSNIFIWTISGEKGKGVQRIRYHCGQLKSW